MNHVDRSKYRGEMWTKKFTKISDPWQTCNREYGDFTPRKEVVKMEPEIDIDEGPWIARTYQMGYNVKPEHRHKWMDSWRGYVKRKKPAQAGPYRSLKNIQKGAPPKSNPGVRLPPLEGGSAAQSARTERDIVVRDGAIYMPAPRSKPSYSRVNERFFNFQYKDIWLPTNLR